MIQPTGGLNDPNYKISNVIFPDGNEINFKYEKLITTKYATSTMQKEKLDQTIPGIVSNGGSCYNYTDLTDKLLTRIDFPRGKIYFYYNDDVGAPDRLDLIGDKYLKKIIVKNNNGKIIKDYNFHYDYFTSDSEGYSYPFYQGYGDGIDKRLKLTSVIDNLAEGNYLLEYYENYNLPPRFSYAIDYWGVFNGKNENNTYFPTTKYEKIYTDNEEYIKVGANRNPDFNYGIIGNLKRITYPTGGYSEIKYEADEYYDENDSIKYTYQYPIDYLDGVSIYNYPGADEVLFEVNGIKAYNFEKLLFINGLESDDNTQIGHDCKARLFKLNNNQEVEVGKISDAGNYKYKFTFYGTGDPETGQIPACQATVYWIEEFSELVSKTKKAGTIRVKEIIKKESNNELIKRSFTYLDPTTNYALTSGKNLGTRLLSPLSTEISPYVGGGTIGTYTRVLYINNDPGWELSNIQGKAIAYDYVQEIYQSKKDSTKNFTREYKFYNDFYIGDEDPYSQNSSWPLEYLDRGQLLEVNDYDSNGVILKKTENEYAKTFNYVNNGSTAQNEGTSLWGVGSKIRLKAFRYPDPSHAYFRGEFEYTTFFIQTEWIQNVKTTTTDYENGQPKMITEVFNEYSPEYKHTFLSKKITENSLGETQTTEYQYPQDLAGQRPYMSTLVSENRISDPVVTKTYNNVQTTPLSISETVYEDFDPSGNTQVLPKYVFAKKNSQTLNYSPTGGDLKISYERYDAQGNLEQYRLADGTPVSIIWGYNGQYPIAKVEGVAYTDIETEANTLAANNNLTESSFNTLRGIVNASNKFGMLTCYIYEPLVGVKMIIQPNGQKEIYEYDTAGRLMKVKDQDGKELKKIDYHYSTQP